ncbi:hypothetical protein QTG54_016692 [Skeletonema marinoi]|uniref:TLDc domain-containing protein n=1 Tax=Skeletonema marinoi TaxID=267567 RepID=A0AAD8XSL2_9STRA|nr:hypothetical protein QTG54_016692 [Skeletonema marinoi]
MSRRTTKKAAQPAPAPAPVAASGATRKRIDKLDDLDQTNKRLKTTLDKIDRDRATQMNKLQEKEKQLLDRLSKLNEEKHKTASANGNIDVSDDDFLEINAGGKVIAVKRATLTQLQGSRLEAMFSGRWDKKLDRDSSGRLFLDVNSDCFQAIVDYMNELAISSEDDPPMPPTVDDELQHILSHQMNLFGLTVDVDPQIDSNIITQHSDTMILHNWLEEDGSGGELELLYRSSRDGLTSANFHSKCDNKGPTVVIIETVEGGVIGGYANTAWKSNGANVSANKAFLFALSGFGLLSPCKMKLKNASDQYAIFNHPYGPMFGNGHGRHDLYVGGSTLYLRIGRSYYPGPTEQLTGGRTYNIKEMEVFQVTDNPSPLQDPRKKQPHSSNPVEKVVAVDTFSKEVNDAINEKWTTLQELEAEVLSLEESFKDEEEFIESFGSEDPNNVVMLNVSGTMMATSRATLLLPEDSVLAQQFDNSKWTEQGSASPRVKDWTPDDVTNWVKSVKDVPDDIATLFWENEIKGSELLALDKDGLKMIGVKRAGTICLLLKEIKQLEEASQDTATLIEYSPYCFGKILDYLRLKRLQTLGLVDEPALPIVCESQKKRFEKVVKYYFPGNSSFILG